MPHPSLATSLPCSVYRSVPVTLHQCAVPILRTSRVNSWAGNSNSKYYPLFKSCKNAPWTDAPENSFIMGAFGECAAAEGGWGCLLCTCVLEAAIVGGGMRARMLAAAVGCAHARPIWDCPTRDAGLRRRHGAGGCAGWAARAASRPPTPALAAAACRS